MRDIYLIGAGISNLTLARLLADDNIPCTIIEKRDKIGGNCSSHFENGIEVHDYGSHIFHTESKEVWDFMNRFTEFNNYRHHVISNVNGKTYFMPFNLSLINSFYSEIFPGFQSFSPSEAKNFIEDSIRRYKDKMGEEFEKNGPSNLEEQAISLVGEELYETFIRGYTAKQWNTDPVNLDPSIIKRIPIRYNYNTEYFNDKYHGIPLHGYQDMFEKMIASNKIKLVLNQEFTEEDIDEKNVYVFSGQLDKFFKYKFGNLGWRSLRFENQLYIQDDFQGTSVINFPGEEYRFTRVHEYKHYHPETLCNCRGLTVVCKEYPAEYEETDEPFYPINNPENDKIQNKYLKYIKKNLPLFIENGRLSNYRYFDMDDAVLNAISLKLKVLELLKIT